MNGWVSTDERETAVVSLVPDQPGPRGKAGLGCDPPAGGRHDGGTHRIQDLLFDADQRKKRRVGHPSHSKS